MSVRFVTVALMCAGLLAVVVSPARAFAQEPLAFTLPADDGYGIGECLQAGSACGEALATAFCQAHGYLKAVAFGAADVTGTTPGISPIAVERASVSIRCGD